MAKSQTLETLIKINAKTGNGFSEVGSTLQNLGNLVSQISTPLLEFGKESTEVYRNYELSMKDAEIALATTYGKNSNALSNVMEQLNESASQWAATTKFHTDDVANAIANAAHAGWDLNEIMTGIPAAMKLAQAGGLDLSQSVDYIVKASNGAGLEFDQMSHFIDLWAFTANSTATDIGEMGDALVRLGPLMKFTDSSEELMTILGTVADVGITGSQAGTMLRSSLLRLIAPTKNAAEAMDELEATDEELLELADMTDELAEANARLEAAGFSMYDENGKMKPVLDTFEDLYMALGNINGGFDDLYKNGDVNKIMAAIFPQRSLVAAEALLEAAGNGWNGLYESMMNGDAEGYADYAAEERLNTLDGALSILDSKVEELKRKTGKELSDPIENIAGILGGIVDNLNTMDPTAFSAIVSGLSVIAGAGPGIFVAGTAIKWMGSALSALSTPLSAAVLTGVALTAGVAALNEFAEADYASRFGDLTLDAEEITGYLDSLNDSFTTASEGINTWAQNLSTATENYKSLSSELSKNLITDMLTNKELTKADKDALYGLGDQMLAEIKKGINASGQEAAADMLRSATADGEVTEEESDLLSSLSAAIQAGMEEEIAKAEGLSAQLRDALTKAFNEGLTSDNLAAIQGLMDEMNAVVADIQDTEDYVQEQALLRKAQRMGLEGVEDITALAESQIEDKVERMHQENDATYRKAEKGNAIRVANGEITEEESAAELEALVAMNESALQEYTRGEKDLIAMARESAISGSELSETWDVYKQAAQAFRENGGIVSDDIANAFNEGITNERDARQTSQFLARTIEALGGYEELAPTVKALEAAGDFESAGYIQMLADMSDMFGGNLRSTFLESGRVGEAEGYAGTDLDRLQQILLNSGTAMTPEGLWEGIQEGTLDLSSLDFQSALMSAATSGGYGNIEDWVGSMFGGTPEVDVQATATELDTSAIDNEEVELDATFDENVADEVAAQGIDVPVNLSMAAGATSGSGGLFESVLNEKPSVEVDVKGNTQPLHDDIKAEDEQLLNENIQGTDLSLASTINAQDGRHITVYIDQVGGGGGTNLMSRFAEGGRATEASIFGEGSTPEWAIPEEHSERTASLLDQARRASGFTWPEILSRFGGLNANPENVATTIVYSPTINAADATGVAQALSADKDRFERWFRERQMREALEVYA